MKATASDLQTLWIDSAHLERQVQVDIYLHLPTAAMPAHLLLVNDGQDLVKMHFADILSSTHAQSPIGNLVVAAIHCGEDRRNEYGMLAGPDYKGRGSKAVLYKDFIFSELLPQLYSQLAGLPIKSRSFAGFSLGGLSALDLVWNFPQVFSMAAVFSGSFWWRSKDQNDRGYDESRHRMMHWQISQGSYQPGLKFFFECGELDETEDRNRNGVIDSIDDTIDLMRALQRKGYREGLDMRYLQLADGHHDVATWAKAWPVFLRWAFPAA